MPVDVLTVLLEFVVRPGLLGQLSPPSLTKCVLVQALKYVHGISANHTDRIAARRQVHRGDPRRDLPGWLRWIVKHQQ